MKSLRSINLNLLPILHELLMQANVTKAANKLNLSQSATSEALGRLRDLFDDPLLVREGRLMLLTPFAKNLLPHLKDALQSIELAMSERAFDALASERKLLVSATDVVPFLLGRSLSDILAEQSPHIQVQFIPLELSHASRLEVGSLDFVICPRGFLQAENLNSIFLFNSEMVGIASKHNDKIYDNMPMQDYLKLRHIAFAPGEGAWDTMESRALAICHQRQHNSIALPYFFVQAFLVKGTDNVALIHRQTAEALAELLELKIFKPPIEIPVVPVRLFWGKVSDTDPAHQWMRRAIESIVKSS